MYYGSDYNHPLLWGHYFRQELPCIPTNLFPPVSYFIPVSSGWTCWSVQEPACKTATANAFLVTLYSLQLHWWKCSRVGQNSTLRGSDSIKLSSVASEELQQRNVCPIPVCLNLYEADFSVGVTGMLIEINSSHNFCIASCPCLQRVTLKLSHYSNL